MMGSLVRWYVGWVLRGGKDVLGIRGGIERRGMMEIRVGYDGVETGFGEVVWGEG